MTRAPLKMQPNKLGQGKNRRKIVLHMGKDSAPPVLRPSGPAKAVSILSRRIYGHLEVVFNAGITKQAVFQRCPGIGQG